MDESRPFSETNRASAPENGAIYGELSPNIRLGLRLISAATIFMLSLSFIFSLVQGSKVNSAFYLCACNLVISMFVALVTSWWYRRGDLSTDKYWFMMLIGFIIIFQCIATDIFVFHGPVKSIPAPTVTPNTTTPKI